VAADQKSYMQLQRAAELCGLRRYEEAAAAVASVIASDPENYRAWALLSQAKLGMGQHNDALNAARRTQAASPDQEWAYRLASIALRGLGRPRAAADAASEAIRLAPHGWSGYVQLAHSFIRMGDRPREACRIADRAVALAPHEPEAHNCQGTAALAAGDRKEAAAAFKRALALDPQNAVAHNELARTHLGRGRFSNMRPWRLASAARGFAAAAGMDPRLEVSRGNVDVVLRTFIGRTAYFLLIAAVVNLEIHSASSSVRAYVIFGGLTLIAGFAIVFTARLPANLRSYLFRFLSRGPIRIAVLLEIVAAFALSVGAFAGHSLRSDMGLLALVTGVIARLYVLNSRFT
jgi:tetratricopeptide (TPR) repeat protein